MDIKSFFNKFPINFKFKTKKFQTYIFIFHLIYITSIILIFLTHIYSYIKNDKYEVNSYSIFNTIDYINTLNLYEKQELNPEMDFYIRLIKNTNFNSNSSYNISEKLLLFDSHSSKWLVENSVLEKNEYFHTTKNLSDLSLDIYYLCKDPNNSDCIIDEDNYEYKAIIKYKGFELNHQDDSSPIKKHDKKYFEIICPFYFNNPIINSLNWHVVIYKENIGIINSLMNKRKEYIAGYIKDFNSQPNYKENKKKLYEGYKIKYNGSIKFTNEIKNIMVFKRIKKGIVSFERIEAFFILFNSILIFVLNYYMKDNNNNKIEENNSKLKTDDQNLGKENFSLKNEGKDKEKELSLNDVNNLNIIRKGMKKEYNKEGRINEALIPTSKLNKLDIYLFYVSKSVCKIIFRNNNKIMRTGSGFLLKLYKGSEPLFFLMTNNHVIEEEMINLKKKIDIYYGIPSQWNVIHLNKKKRFIRNFLYLDMDVVIIQILKEDNIKEKYFLSPNIEYINKSKELENKKIFIPQFPEGGDLSYAYGQIKSVDQYEICHLSSTKKGSSGSPIFLENTNLVIGIHKSSKKDENENFGEFIGPIIQSIEQDSYEKKNDENGKYEGDIVNGKYEGYGKYTWKNNNYYIGEFKEGKMHNKGIMFEKINNITNIFYKGEFLNDKKKGKGKICDIKGNILYEGNFIDDKLEENGKTIKEFFSSKKEGKINYEDGTYYIGESLINLRHGRGIIYNKDNKEIYNGDFIFNKKEGEGKYLYENDDYYIGHWLNDLENGKGIIYNKNGDILYDGDFVNGKKEGNGKWIFEDGKFYYIGQFSNNLRNGKGKTYYKNGDLLFEGNFVNGKKEGNGKLIFENGNYYIGQFSNNLRNGKGIQYYKHGNIQYEGDFINGKRNGYGKMIFVSGKYYIGQFTNNLRNGKGTLYYKNGNIQYEGDFVNDKVEGNGKAIYKEGIYYIGQFSNNLMNGKGTQYYKNGDLLYEGNFVNGKREGNGKYIHENGDYYIGQFSNGLRHGKGIDYYKNGDIKYDGDFINDKREGKGKLIFKNDNYYIGDWLNDLRHRKGCMYTANNKIIKRGDYIEDVFETDLRKD